MVMSFSKKELPPERTRAAVGRSAVRRTDKLVKHGRQHHPAPRVEAVDVVEDGLGDLLTGGACHGAHSRPVATARIARCDMVHARPLRRVLKGAAAARLLVRLDCYIWRGSWPLSTVWRDGPMDSGQVSAVSAHGAAAYLSALRI
jgi:hypothetical protein